VAKSRFAPPNPDALVEEAIKRRHAAEEARQRKNLEPDPAPSEPRPKDAPVWSPQGVDLDRVPPEIRQAITELIQPVYEQYVLQSKDALEKSLGASMAHLLWLEVLDQVDIRREYINVDAVVHVTINRPAMVERHLRLLGSKLKITHFLLRLNELRTRMAQNPDTWTLLANHERDCPDFRLNENGTGYPPGAFRTAHPSTVCPNPPAPVGTVPLRTTEPNSDRPNPPVADETAFPPAAISPADNCEINHAPPEKSTYWPQNMPANSDTDSPATRHCPIFRLNENETGYPPGAFRTADPSSDRSHPPAADATASPPGALTPTNNCQPDQPPPPVPGKSEVWRPKHGAQSKSNQDSTPPDSGKSGVWRPKHAR
jgi:hypothetical protein